MFIKHYRSIIFYLMMLIVLVGCSSSDSELTHDTAQIDTLSTGEIIILNSGDPIWETEDMWTITEQSRYGTGVGSDSILFGQIRSFDVDSHGQLFVLDAMTQEIYIYDVDGNLNRTVGGQGSGPQEFTNAVSAEIASNGEIWVVEMVQGRLTILDSGGDYLRSQRLNTTGRSYSFYPGGFDWQDRYNALIFQQGDQEIMPKQLLVRFDENTIPLDTIDVPENPQEMDFFTLSDDAEGRQMNLMVSIPFQGSFQWIFSPNGTLWTLFTGTYELVEKTTDGNILRKASKSFEPIAVTSSELEDTRQRLSWFVEQGGKLDMSRIPRHKPVARSFFGDDQGYLWVILTDSIGEDGVTMVDIFNSEGFFLGNVELPFSLSSNYDPIVLDEVFYGIIEGEDGGQEIVKASIQK